MLYNREQDKISYLHSINLRYILIIAKFLGLKKGIQYKYIILDSCYLAGAFKTKPLKIKEISLNSKSDPNKNYRKNVRKKEEKI